MNRKHFSFDSIPCIIFISMYTIYIEFFESMHPGLFNQFLADEYLHGFKPKYLDWTYQALLLKNYIALVRE